MGINQKPYPPVVNTWTPATVIGDTIKVYFSLSAYSSIEAIRTDLILIDISDDINNETIVDLNKNEGNSQLISVLQVDDNNNYFVEIDTRQLKVSINSTYKVQLRFVSSELTVTKKQFQDNLNNSFQSYISDYSSVTLVKIISKPKLELGEFLDVGTHANYIISAASLSVIGKLVFNTLDSEEFLSYYKIQLFQLIDNDYNAIVDTGNLYPDSKELNTIFYTVKQDLINGEHYLLKIVYTTSSGYSETLTYPFEVEYNTNIGVNAPQIITELDKEDGSIKISIEGDSNELYSGFYILRRTDSSSNFSQWDDLKFFYNENEEPINAYVIDFLVQPGIIYRYQVIPMDKGGYRGLWNNNTISTAEVFCDFEDIHLDGNSANRYKIKHNPSISSFQYTVTESKTDTLGGKYPFIRRNGDTYYRQFALAGMITHFNENDYPDEYMAENIKRTASNTNGEAPLEDYFNKRIKERVANNDAALKSKYDEYYYSKNYLNGYTDYLVEKGYRDDITDYLYQNKVRLFRSPTEGNILVKLMNITLTPNGQLDRRIYSMQCTAYEVDTFSIENCIKYHIWDDNKIIFDNLFYNGYLKMHIGQIRHNDEPLVKDMQNGPFIRTDLFEEIVQDVKEHNADNESLNVEKIVWLKTDFYSSPSPFGKKKNGECTWGILPTGRLFKYFMHQEDQTDDDNLIVEIRTYDSIYPPNEINSGLTTGFFDVIAPNNLTLVFQSLQKLAYIIVNYMFGKSFSFNNSEYFWDDIKDENIWTQEVINAFLNELVNRRWLNLANSNFFIADEDNNKVLKNQLAWCLNDVLENCIDLQSNGAYYVERYSQYSSLGERLQSDVLFNFINEDFNLMEINRNVAQAILQFSVDFPYQPYNGYWYSQLNGTGPYLLQPLKDNIYSQQFISFWFSLAVAMAIGARWGFGTLHANNITIGNIININNDEAILVDGGLSSNILNEIETGEIKMEGHGLYVNHELVVVPPQGYYNLTESDTSVIHLIHQRFKDEPLKCLIDYIAQYRIFSFDDTSNSYRTKAKYYKIGQLRGFQIQSQEQNRSQEIISIIKNKYNENTLNKIKNVIGIHSISIEAEPFTEIEVYEEHDLNDLNYQPKTFTIGETGILTLTNLDNDVQEIYIINNPLSTIEDRNETIYTGNNASNNILVNYICLIKEMRSR